MPLPTGLVGAKGRRQDQADAAAGLSLPRKAEVVEEDFDVWEEKLDAVMMFAHANGGLYQWLDMWV